MCTLKFCLITLCSQLSKNASLRKTCSHLTYESSLAPVCCILGIIAGWEPGPSPARKPRSISAHHRQSNRTRPNYHGTLYSASMNPSPPIDYLFRHYDNIDQYITDYRTYHTHRQTGGTRGYCPLSASGELHVTLVCCFFSMLHNLMAIISLCLMISWIC